MSRIFRELQEASDDFSSSDYKTVVEKKHFGKITVTKSHSSSLSTDYFTVATRENLFQNKEGVEHLVDEVTSSLRFFMKKYDIHRGQKVLVICLGNEKITSDSFAPRTGEKLFVTSHIYHEDNRLANFGNLGYVKCGVSGNTGVESFLVTTGVIKTTRPDIVLAIDTLACQSVQRLGCTIQLSDGGIEPGGGVGNRKTTLSKDTLKVPVIAIGVPFVIYLRRIFAEYAPEVNIDTIDKVSDMIIAVRETDFLVDIYSTIVANAINSVVHEKAMN